MKKPLILLFTLAIPVALFLFLKFFGENKYEVPVFFENGIEGCINATSPHVMDISQLFDEQEGERAKTFTVIAVIDTAADDNLKMLITEMIQIQDAFFGKPGPTFIFISENASSESVARRLDLSVKTGLEEKNTILKQFQDEQFRDFLHCGLGLTANGEHQKTDLVLVDDIGRVRGFYPRNDAEQTDRLIIELKILLHQK